MLGPEYYDGTMERNVLDVIAKITQRMTRQIVKEEKKDGVGIINVDDLLILPEVYREVIKVHQDKQKNDVSSFLGLSQEEIECCYMFFCRNVKWSYSKHSALYDIHYPVADGEDIFVTKVYTLSAKVLSAFIEFKMYTIMQDYDSFRLSVVNKIDFPVENYPMREGFVDGQLKILTDVILAVDAAGRDITKVLVVGSASEDGVSSGLAYGIIPYMVDNALIDLYDPFNNPGEVDVKGVHYRYFRDEKKIEKNDSKMYDLLLDDAWERSCSRPWDKDGNYKHFRHYSVKWFRDMNVEFKSVFSHIYYQAFSTGEHEQRLVSRRVTDLNLRYHPILGDCPGCRELKYNLNRIYSDDFYRYYMSCHQVNCIDKSIRRVPLRNNDDSRIEQMWYEVQYQDQENNRELKSVYYDKIVEENVFVVPINQVFKGDSLIFSEYSSVRQNYYRDCFVLVKNKQGTYCNKMGQEGCYYTGNKVEYNGVQVLQGKYADRAIKSKMKRENRGRVPDVDGEQSRKSKVKLKKERI